MSGAGAGGFGDEFYPEEELDQMEPMDVKFDDLQQFDEEEDAMKHANWLRPEAKPLDPKNDDLVFQQLEVDTVGGPVDSLLHQAIQQSKHKGGKTLQNQPVAPILRLFGVNKDGNSVCATLHGFEPYFYVQVPRGFCLIEGPAEMMRALNNQVGGNTGRGGVKQEPVNRIEVEYKCPIWFYQKETKQPFLKVVCSMPGLVTPCRTTLSNKGLIIGGQHLKFLTYESNVLYILRFMVDSGLQGAAWVKLPAGTYRMDPGHQGHGAGKTYCQIEVHALADDVISLEQVGEYQGLAPLRILSVDIECKGRKGSFPEAEKDPVIQIASLVTELGKSEPLLRNILTLDTCAPIVGAQVMSFERELELLSTWQRLLIETDADIIIGWNTSNFDLPYLINRAKTLRGMARDDADRKKMDKFMQWGRMKGCHLRMKQAQFSSKAYGTHEYQEIIVEGRTQIDLMLAVQRDHKLSSYSLNAVSAHFLGEQKEDVHHSIIGDLQDGNADTRRRLAVYCLKDAYLPQRIMDKLMYMYNYVEMARVTGVPLSFLLTRGQSIKVFSQILRKARQKALLVPFKEVTPGAAGDGGVAYEGATVLSAKSGFYRGAIATLDFASLYPSIMMAHNLCYSTLVPKGAVGSVGGVAEADVAQAPNGEYFVREGVREGVLPEILRELISARKQAKRDLKEAKDPFVAAVMNGRQLALKLSANSVYGFTGAIVGKLPCLEISGAVTAYGRTMIEHTQSLVESMYCKAKGYEADAEVVYGDTDSVMVNFKVDSIERSMELGLEAANAISNTFKKPVQLEFEKVYCPFLLITKKRYAGLMYSKPDKHDKIDTKGIETVRRDNCQLVRNIIEVSLEKILLNKDVDGAVAYVKNTISQLLTNKIDMSQLVVTKGLTQAAENYDSKAAHVELTKKMYARNPATAPVVGDRVPYVIIQGPKGAKAYEKAEDPIYALENNLPIDSKHYLEHHLSQPLMRLFEPILKNPKELLTGDHTRTITVATPSLASGGIMRFTKKQITCLSCKAPLKGNVDTVLCEHCRPQQAKIYAGALGRVNECGEQFNRLWTQCQRCQGSLHQDVLCTSRDCPIFYRRKKIQKEMSEASGVLQRFVDW